MLCQQFLKSWSSTQTAVSLSGGEAEFYGVVKASGIGLGYQALLEDLGYVLPIRVWTDSSATMGICARVGLGKLRHIDTNCLWIQAKVRSGAILLHKVKGEVNPADLFTKHLSSNDRIVSLLRLFWVRVRQRQVGAGPEASRRHRRRPRRNPGGTGGMVQD